MSTEIPPPSSRKPRAWNALWLILCQWVDSDYQREGLPDPATLPARVDWQRTLPFLFMHVGCLAVFWVGASTTAVVAAVVLYAVRMFAITGFYHRYFSHKTFKTSRVAQFVFAVLGNCSMQRGPLWWAATHRHHHKHSDHEEDIHSPRISGFVWSHIGWLTSTRNFPTNYKSIPDLAKYPELVFLNRRDQVVPFFYGLLMLLIGWTLQTFAPSLGVTVAQFFVWTFFISTTVLLHGTLFINSLAHVWGRKAYETDDDSRNSWLLTLITLGEGWHNNHHRYPHSVRQGFRWWQLDPTYYALRLLSWLGVIWDLRPVPKSVIEEANMKKITPAAQRMNRKKIAIVGSGISGLASAWFLSRDHDVTLFEQDERIGGHTNTVMVAEGDAEIPIDTGFMVYNEVTYPLLTRLFRELDVATKPTTMSFSVQHVADGLEFNGAGFNLLFGQRRNLFNIRYWRMLMQIARFNRETVAELRNPTFAEMSLGDYVEKRGYGTDFLRWYLSPMASAVWSSPPERIEEFPARTLMRFWHNHGFLGMDTHHPWRTVSGGSRSYVAKITQPFEQNIHRGAAVCAVSRIPGGSQVTLSDGTRHDFDQVVIAAHGDQALRLLGDPTELEKQLLGNFRYQKNEAVLHTDPCFMPKTRRCWASWNYRIDRPQEGNHRYSTHYWMNELQGVSEIEQYFVSINPPCAPDEKRVKKRLTYEHPLFDLKAVAAQERLTELDEAGSHSLRFFCGAWQRYGFHEDGLWSAERICLANSREGPMDMNALYECNVTHCRLKPKRHAFDYRVFMFSVDIDELPALARRLRWFSHNRFNLFSIDDRDHVDLGASGGLRGNLTAWLAERNIACPGDARIQLLTFPRVLGYGFNPVSFYFMHARSGEPIAAVAEVVNTFREMKLFALHDIGEDGLWHLRIAKNFYVSPFSDPGMMFDFKLGKPGGTWRVNIDEYENDERVLLSSVRGEQRELTSTRLFWYAFSYPLLSLRIIGLIHWHALLLWLKRVPFFQKNERREVQLDVMRPHESLKNHTP